MNLPFTSKTTTKYENQVNSLLANADGPDPELVERLDQALTNDPLANHVDDVSFAPPPPKSPDEMLAIETKAHERSIELKNAEIEVREQNIQDLKGQIQQQEAEIDILKEGVSRNENWLNPKQMTTRPTSTPKPSKPTKETAQEGEKA